jgi:prolipoprotein diacylglyceryltransferase
MANPLDPADLDRRCRFHGGFLGVVCAVALFSLTGINPLANQRWDPPLPRPLPLCYQCGSMNFINAAGYGAAKETTCPGA